MAKPHRARFVALVSVLARHHGDGAPTLIATGRVLVDGRVVTNPSARVRADASVRVLPERRLRGERKLSAALERLSVPVAGRVALDLGASAGGFTTALLVAGARRVYAVEAGVGQLVGALRLDRRVVNLEGHNVGDLDPRLVPEVIEVVTMDLGYLAVADAVPQLAPLPLHRRVELVALVKPTFELHEGRLAADEAQLDEAVALAERALVAGGFEPLGRCPAPVTGRGGAREVFVHARRTVDGPAVQSTPSPVRGSRHVRR